MGRDTAGKGMTNRRINCIVEVRLCLLGRRRVWLEVTVVESAPAKMWGGGGG